MIKPPFIGLIYYSTLKVNFQIGFDEITSLCVFIKHCIKIYSQATIHFSEVILTPFSPFDIKCKKLNLLSANIIKWSNTLKQCTSWHLKSSCEKPLEMI